MKAPANVTPHAEVVSNYYDIHTVPFYIGETGWNPEHLHFGIFLDRPEEEYKANPLLVLQESAPAVDKMTEVILAPADFKESDMVLDAGCGVGGTGLYINRKYGSSVVGTNINHMQLEIAEERAKEAGVEDKVTFLYADNSLDMPFEDNSMDVIVNIASACHYSDRPKFISECGRILKPGGIMVVQDWMAVNGISEEDRAKYLAPLEESWYLKRLDSLDSYREMLEAAGLEVTEAEYIEKGIPPNAYLIASGYMRLAQKEKEEGLTEYEAGNIGRLKSFADSLLGGYLKIGRYAAVKK